MHSITRLIGTLVLGLSTVDVAFATDYTITTAGDWSTATWTPSTPAAGGSADVTILTGATGDSIYNNDLGTGTTPEFKLNSVVWYSGGPQFTGQRLGFLANGGIQPSLVYDSQDAPPAAFGFGNNIRIPTGVTLTINGNGSDARGPGVATGYEITGKISGAGSLVINGTSVPDDSKDCVMLNNANTYSGATTITSGILNIQNNTALGSADNDAATGTTVEDGATLQLQNTITLGTEQLLLAGLGAPGQNGALVNVSGNNTWGGQVRMGTSCKIAADGGTLLIDNGTATVLQVTDTSLTFAMEAAEGAAIQLGTGDENIGINSGKTNLTFIMDGAGSGTVLTEILGGGGTGTLIKNGAGTWTLGRTYTSTRGWRAELQINNGTLALGAVDAISYLDARNIVRVNNGAALDLAGYDTTVVGVGNAEGDSTGVVTSSGGACTLTVGQVSGSTVGPLQSSTFEGSIQDGAGSIALNKVGSEAFTLSGANTYSGDTTVSEGTLLVNGSIGSGAVTVVSGATLGGHGTVGGVATINGTVSPGMSIGALTFSSAPTLNGLTLMEIDKGASPNADKLVLSSGTLALGGTLTVNNVGAALTGGEVFDLFDAATITGAFSESPILPSLDAGLNWWTGSLAVDGTIKVNRKPSSGVDALTTRTNVPVIVNVIKLLHNDSDGDGDTLSITGVGNALPSGASVALVDGEVTYTPKPDSEESGSFEYTLDDGHGGVVAVTVSVTVTGSSGGGSPNIVYGPIKEGDEFVVRFAGIPGFEYTVEWSPTATGGWTKMENKTASTDNSGGIGIGIFEVRDATAETSRFYRTVYPSY